MIMRLFEILQYGDYTEEDREEVEIIGWLYQY
jgi:hypothetical protein